MNPDSSQLLAQLIDIHPAAEPGWWPPAPGWWVLAFLCLLLVVFMMRWVSRRLAVRRRQKQWLRELESIVARHDPEEQPHEHLAALNRLFRAVALRAFPGKACAGLQGQDWVRFVAMLMPEEIDSDSLEALAQGPYRPAPDFDATALHRLARIWVAHYG
jgi:HAMP domain-containing protein